MRPGNDQALSVEAALERGLSELRALGEWMRRIDAAESLADEAEEAHREGESDRAAVDGAIGALAVALLDQDEDEAEESDFAEPEPAAPTMVVLPPFDPQQKKPGAAREVAKALEPIAGKALPIREIANPATIKTALLPRFPHFDAELDLILTQRLPWRLLLVGAPGCGKTELTRALAEAAEIPHVVYGCAGVSDASFGGTSAQWSTARPSIPLQLIQRSRVASPIVILDEVDKADTDRRNGALGDTLLTFLEPASARRVMDLGLELEVDVSAVSYIATANRIEDVPTPLRDRLRAIRMPTPSDAHLGQFVQTILDDIAAERGLDRRWLTDLAQDEEELVRQTWPGGSLRRLRRILERLLEGRDALTGRA